MSDMNLLKENINRNNTNANVNNSNIIKVSDVNVNRISFIRQNKLALNGKLLPNLACFFYIGNFMSRLSKRIFDRYSTIRHIDKRNSRSQ